MITIENLKTKTVGRRAQQVLIRHNGNPVGLLEKLANSAHDIHPWKAFFYLVPPGRHVQTEYLGAFYKADGGKNAAVNAIIKRATT